MKKEYIYEKLDEADILEILIEFLQEKHDLPNAQILLLGERNKDLRCVCALCEDEHPMNLDLNEVDKQIDFTGDHKWLEQNPECWL